MKCGIYIPQMNFQLHICLDLDWNLFYTHLKILAPSAASEATTRVRSKGDSKILLLNALERDINYMG